MTDDNTPPILVDRAKGDANAASDAPAYDYDSLPDVAKRALAEAQERRDHAAQNAMPKEYGGRDGPEPVRFGDWEKKGLAIDF